MKVAVLVVSALAASWHVADATADTACPATTTDDPLFGTSLPGWYGTEALAVQLSSPATWPTTPPGHLIGQKLFWRSSGFQPGTESELEISIRSLDGAPITGGLWSATNAYVPLEQRGASPIDAQVMLSEMQRSPERWRMLTGVDFPEPGCWEVTATYLGQALTFVVETVRGGVSAGASAGSPGAGH
jgi:hypothetical protein